MLWTAGESLKEKSGRIDPAVHIFTAVLFIQAFNDATAMPRRRVKVEFEDGEGGKYTISLDGSISKEKVLKIMDLVELLGVPEEDSYFSNETVVGRLYQLIEKKFPLGHFTSNDILESYEDEYSQPIRLGTVSTYLSRFADQKILHRVKTGINWSYRRAHLNVKEQR